MGQTSESGAEAAAMGHLRARGLIKLLNAQSLSSQSNEVLFEGQRAVIKSCRPNTTSIGITPSMAPQLELILAALEDKFGDIQVVRASINDLRKHMYDGRQKTPLKMVKRSDIERFGRPIARFKVTEVEAAGRR